MAKIAVAQVRCVPTMVLRHPPLLNVKSRSEHCAVLEDAVNLCPGCSGQVRLRGTCTIVPLMEENAFRRGRFLRSSFLECAA